MTRFTEYHNFRPLFQAHKILEQSRMNAKLKPRRRNEPTILKAFQNNDNLKLLARKVFERHTKRNADRKINKIETILNFMENFPISLYEVVIKLYRCTRRPPHSVLAHKERTQS